MSAAFDTILRKALHEAVALLPESQRTPFCRNMFPGGIDNLQGSELRYAIMLCGEMDRREGSERQDGDGPVSNQEIARRMLGIISPYDYRSWISIRGALSAIAASSAPVQSGKESASG